MEPEEKKPDKLHEIQFPDDLDTEDLNRSELYTSGHSFLEIERKSVLFTKRCLDIIGSVFGLIMASPIMLVVAIAVKFTSPGPVFYRQERLGINNKKFNLIKFRTMKQDAESESGAVWAEESGGRVDPRVTPIGDFLRKSHLDEFPQLFLVLRGTMSLVGPRPERPEFLEHLDTFAFSQERTIALKPGVTGISQVTREKKEDVDTNEKLFGDHSYSIHLCKLDAWGVLLLDLEIIFATVFKRAWQKLVSSFKHIKK